MRAGRRRTKLRSGRWGLAVVALLGSAGACGDDAGGSGEGGDARDLEVVIADDTSPIVRVEGTTCAFDGDTGLGASGIVQSAGDDTHYVSVTVRFTDADGVRVELSSDSVTELRRGESARWDVSLSSIGAVDVRRCEISAAVS